jgi:hypothetical protein
MASSTRPEPRFSTEVSLEPAKNGAFLLRAKVTDLATGEVLAGLGLKLAAGQPGEATSTLKEMGLGVLLKANVEEGGASAVYSVEVKRADLALTQHSARIALK